MPSNRFNAHTDYGIGIGLRTPHYQQPSPRVYALGVETFRLRAAEMLFVSSNWWDVAGASSFGYMVCRCNRSNADIDFLTGAPDLTVARVDEIAVLF
jgi:2-haloacid dehalogenase